MRNLLVVRYEKNNCLISLFSKFKINSIVYITISGEMMMTMMIIINYYPYYYWFISSLCGNYHRRRAGSDDEGDEDAAEDAAEDTDQNVEVVFTPNYYYLKMLIAYSKAFFKKCKISIYITETDYCPSLFFLLLYSNYRSLVSWLCLYVHCRIKKPPQQARMLLHLSFNSNEKLELNT